MRIEFKGNKGITLVALVVTIIVLVILATISITLVLNQNGIFNQANQARELSIVNDYKEKIELILNEEKIKTYTEKKTFTINNLIERFNIESFVGNAERVDLEETENKGIIRITTTDGYLYEVIIEEDTIYCVSQGKDNGEPYPTINLEQLPMQGTENEKIQIKVTGAVSGGKETTGIAQVERLDNKEKKEYVEEGVIFEIGANGIYTFSATTNKGKSKIAKITINIEQPANTISIMAKPTTPTKEKVEITIKYGETALTNSDKYQYRIGSSGSWEISSTNETIVNINENEVIVVRYYDGKNSFKVQTYNIQNIDKVAPNNFNYTVAKTTNSIKIEGNTTDTGTVGCASGNIGIARYEYSKDNGTIWQISNSFTGLTTGSYTVKMRATDKAGNVTYGKSAIEKIETETVTLGTVATGDITITPSTTSPTNENITIAINYGNSGYTRQYKKSTDANWTTVTGTNASFAVDKNMSIAVRYYDGTNAFNGTSYNVQNIDKVAPNNFTPVITGKSNSVKVTANTTDKTATTDSIQSGIQGYRFSIDNGATWTNYITNGEKEYTNLSQNTNYTVIVQAKDNAGNSTQASASIKTNIVPNNTLSFTKTVWSNGNTKTTIATADKNYKIQYQINSTSGTWTTAGINGINITTNDMTSGQTVYARLWDGNNASTTVQNYQTTQTSKMIAENGPTYVAGTTKENMTIFNGWNAFLNYDIEKGSYRINATDVTGGGYLYVPNIDITNIDYISMDGGGFRDQTIFVDDKDTGTRLMQIDFVNPNGTQWYSYIAKKIITGVTGTHNLKIYGKCSSHRTNVMYLNSFHIYYK